jgi:inner membrane protein
LDNVTHAALGLAISEAGFPSLGRAGLALALVASELPDIDIFFGMGNAWSMVTMHRGITHSLLLMPLAAATLAGIWWWFGAAGAYRAYLALALVCLLGHISLDVLTSYGTQILEPLSHHRFGLGWVAVLDPAVTLALLAGGIGAWWMRGSDPAAAARLALAGLVVTACYMGTGALQHARAMRVLQRQTASLGEPLAADATPQLGTIFLWRLLYRNADTFWLARYNSLTGDLSGAQAVAASVDPALRPLLESPRAKTFRHFAGGLILPHLENGNPGALVLEDMRFSWPTDAPQGLWALRIEFDGDHKTSPQVRDVQFVQRQMRFGGAGPVRERNSPVPLATR